MAYRLRLWPTAAPAIVLMALLLTLVGCDSSPQLAPLNTPTTVLSFGDSLTYGTGASPEQSYPAQLQQLTGLTVINAGISGELAWSTPR